MGSGVHTVKWLLVVYIYDPMAPLLVTMEYYIVMYFVIVGEER